MLSTATAILAIDTLWGGDVLCASGTGRFIADSWFSDEPLPPAYTHPMAARIRESGGVSAREPDREAIGAYLRDIDIPGAIRGMLPESGATGLRAAYIANLADCFEVMWDLALENPRRRPRRALRAQRGVIHRQSSRAVAAGSQPRSRRPTAGRSRLPVLQSRPVA